MKRKVSELLGTWVNMGLFRIKGHSGYFRDKYGTSNPVYLAEAEDTELWEGGWGASGAPVCTIYGWRNGVELLPTEGRVYYGHVLCAAPDGGTRLVGELVHQEELEELGDEVLGEKGMGKPLSSLDAKYFWSKVQKTETCWLWLGGTTKEGYGQVGLKGRSIGRRAHRIAWELTYGPIPNGMNVLHHCDNPPCVNPNHLFLGTHADNVHDMMDKGHLVVPDNTGEKNGRAKLTVEQVREIKEALKHYHYGMYSQLGRQYGVAEYIIRSIKVKKLWRDVNLHESELEPYEGLLALPSSKNITFDSLDPGLFSDEITVIGGEV